MEAGHSRGGAEDCSILSPQPQPIESIGENFQDYSWIQDFEAESRPQNTELGGF